METKMLKKIFKIISFYDEVRWSSISNYNLINFYKNKKELDDDTKLLTHWLCYIADRQMAFKRVWDVGGFVFSELVDTIKKVKTLGLLNPDNPNSFMEKNKQDGFVFKSNSIVNNNEILQQYGFKNTDYVHFASRYYPSDYFSILYTFDILRNNYDFSLTKFIIEQLKRHQETDDYIKRILFSLYLLTYFEIEQPKKSDISDFEKNIEKAKERTKKVLSILNDKFEEEYKTFKKETIFKQKRAWCSLRDFLKSPEFKKYFEDSLVKEGATTKQLFTQNSFQQLELPGDVWNNNLKFRNCILEYTEYKNSKDSLNKILRDFFDKNRIDLENCYPEQFDITFDFVPRMCEKDNCDICPIGLIKGKQNSNFKKTCVDNNKLYCSVALINCNYKVDCFGNECKLIKNTIPVSRGTA